MKLEFYPSEYAEFPSEAIEVEALDLKDKDKNEWMDIKKFVEKFESIEDYLIRIHGMFISLSEGMVEDAEVIDVLSSIGLFELKAGWDPVVSVYDLLSIYSFYDKVAYQYTSGSVRFVYE